MYANRRPVLNMSSVWFMCDMCLGNLHSVIIYCRPFDYIIFAVFLISVSSRDIYMIGFLAQQILLTKFSCGAGFHSSLFSRVLESRSAVKEQ